MALSDCPKCWDTPCTCGHKYKTMPLYRVKEIMETTTRVYKKRIANGESDKDPWGAK